MFIKHLHAVQFFLSHILFGYATCIRSIVFVLFSFTFVANWVKFCPSFVQITYSLLFSLVIAFTSDALSTTPDKAPLLSRDASFRHQFHEIVR